MDDGSGAPTRASSDRIRLGFYMSPPALGGAELYLKDLLWHVDRRRFAVTLFVPRWPAFEEFLELDRCPAVGLHHVAVVEPSLGHQRAAGATAPWLRPPGDPAAAYDPFLRAARIALRHLLMPINARRLADALRRAPVDVLHVVNGGYPGAASAQMAAVGARRAGCRGVLMTVANVPYPVAPPRIAERAVDRLVRRSVDMFVVATDGLARCLVERRGVRPAQTAIVPYGIRESYPNGDEPPARIDAGPPPAGPPPGSGLVGMVARFIPEKGHVHFVEAFARLRERCPGARAVLVGDGPTRGAIEAQLRACGLEGRVAFTGHRPLAETLRLMATFDVVALSSELDAMPYVILHAMTLAKPVVATAVGAIPEVVVSGQTGLVVPPRDPEALAEALGGLLETPDRARAMGRAGRTRYEQLFRLGPMIDRHARLYERLATGAPAPEARP